MSGGVFGHAYVHVNDFADTLLHYLDKEIENPDEVLVSYENPMTREVLITIVEQMRVVSRIMRAVEWFYSGDIDELEFITRLANVHEFSRE